MSTEIFTDDVLIQGSEDEVQLTVQGTTGQTDPLQAWKNSSGDEQARITADGRFQNGDMNLSTADALIEAHRDSSSDLPKRGFHSLGRIASALSDAVAWLVAELELIGTGTISGLHRTLRIKLSHSSTGDSSNAELRAGDFELLNQSGSSSIPLGKALGLQASINNQTNAHVDQATVISAGIQNAAGAEIATAKAIEVQAALNDGTIDLMIGLDIADINEATDNYAIRTGEGKVQLGVLNSGLVKASSVGLLSNAAKGVDHDIPMVGANGSVAGQAGIAPQPAATDNSKFLRGDGTWAAASVVASLNDLTDVDTTGVATNNVLAYNGTNWIPQAVSGSGVPTGSGMPFFGSSAPSGWLLCDGSAVSRSTHSALFGIIGTSYGPGDGSTTFNLPDMRGRVAVGAGQGSGLTNRSLASSFGEENHQLTTGELPAHNHSLGSNAPYRLSYNHPNGGSDSGGGSSSIHNLSTTLNTGSNQAHNNMQPGLVANYIIKT
jgi:microcystin-dependent protein